MPEEQAGRQGAERWGLAAGHTALPTPLSWCFGLTLTNLIPGDFVSLLKGFHTLIQFIKEA